MKGAYVGVVRALRRLLRVTGLLALLDHAAKRSRTALWVRSWFAIYDLDDMLRIGLPWWTFEAVDLVEAHLAATPRARILEWGSGASTVWLAARAATVVAVEHDPEWAASMRPRLPDHAQVQTVPSVATGTPAVASRKPGFEGQDFTAYVAAIDDEPGAFDLVVVDGRAREACLAAALPRLAPGGMVVFDNVDRRRYRDAIAEHPELEVLWTRGRTPSLPYPTRTALLRLREERQG
ncbi:class I SAM-dependent methyltransferase [Nocardioides jishulii]|uniref:Class I SAM-dependent methyltransferase n=1 Tax=Nocardioides jishulii TaxID=2575440 RepID=A0A4U2YKA4_9ACTN|nr:class I SAM-dependent methyltransferase [Nocardioides jishulii]QCX27132.1 class I SAM-dependent methyltransferase [Nocardioides jishulii]TKI61616.1 class I SAM-dependent methyltransferase [Nocardioides jishulii]